MNNGFAKHTLDDKEGVAVVTAAVEQAKLEIVRRQQSTADVKSKGSLGLLSMFQSQAKSVQNSTEKDVAPTNKIKGRL